MGRFLAQTGEHVFVEVQRKQVVSPLKLPDRMGIHPADECRAGSLATIAVPSFQDGIAKSRHPLEKGDPCLLTL
jgi:hypothetical protein